MYRLRYACLIGARRGPIAVGIEVIATAIHVVRAGRPKSAIAKAH
jgi:hypothetical protein